MSSLDVVEKAKRIRLERMVRATRDQKSAPLWPIVAASGEHDEARRLLKIRRLQKTKGSNVRVTKAGDWKTIDQREMQAGRARRTQRRGRRAVEAGAGLGLSAFALDRTAPRDAMTDAGNVRRGYNWRRQVGQSRGSAAKDSVRAVGRGMNLQRGMVHGGGALAAVGAAGIAQGHLREKYHQRKINERRRSNRKRVSKAGVWVNPMHGTAESRRELMAAGRAVEQSTFNRAKPRTRVRRPKIYSLDGVGKSELPIAPDYSRGPANYRSGTAAVGRRQPDEFAKGRTGVVQGVLKPKRIAPTRLAPRTLGGSSPTRNPLVHKSERSTELRRRYIYDERFAGRSKQAQRNRSNYRHEGTIGESLRDTYAGGAVGAAAGYGGVRAAGARRGVQALHAEEKRRGVKANPGANRIVASRGSRAFGRRYGVTGAAAGSIAGTIVGSSHHRNKRIRRLEDSGKLAKADRRYDSEDRRQRRLGAAVAGTALGGGLLVARGGKAIRTETRAMRAAADTLSSSVKRPRSFVGTRTEGGQLEGGSRPFTEDERRSAHFMRGHSTYRIPGRAARDIGVGAGLVGASAGAGHHARSSSNKRRF